MFASYLLQVCCSLNHEKVFVYSQKLIASTKNNIMSLQRQRSIRSKMVSKVVLQVDESCKKCFDLILPSYVPCNKGVHVIIIFVCSLSVVMLSLIQYSCADSFENSWRNDTIMLFLMWPTMWRFLNYIISCQTFCFSQFHGLFSEKKTFFSNPTKFHAQ